MGATAVACVGDHPGEPRSPAATPLPAPQSNGLGSAYDVWINNATPLSLVVVVNGDKVGNVQGETQTSISAGVLPALPWKVDVNAANGKNVMSLDVPAGVVWSTSVPNGGEEIHGAGRFIDLACGRIDVWVGPPLGGPVPPASVPPCDPFQS